MTNRIISLVLSIALVFSLILCVPIPATAKNEYISFGSYPQSKVTYAATLAMLNSMVDAEDWISYGYYYGDGSIGSMKQLDYMEYVDVTFNGERYRGVHINQYRPSKTHFSFALNYQFQEAHGYFIENTYWFKYEPLIWRVLDPETGFILCETIIDAQPYNNTIYWVDQDLDSSDYGDSNEFFTDAAATHYGNDYAYSSIRAWLNGEFYNTAFSATEKQRIITTTNSNDFYTGSYLPSLVEYNAYRQPSTDDNVFLLSKEEARNPVYGFNMDTTASSTRCAVASDYAESQGCHTYTGSEEEYGNNKYWLLRTGGYSSDSSYFVYCSGLLLESSDANDTRMGIRPALHLSTAQPLDFSLLEKALNDADEVDRTIYTLATLSLLDNAVNAVPADYTVALTEQDEIASLAETINAAIKNLTVKPANYNAVNAALSAAAAIERSLYSSLSLELLDDAVEAVVFGLDFRKQQQVDDMATAINSALTSMEYANIILHHKATDIFVLGKADILHPDCSLFAEEKSSSELELSNVALGGTPLSLKYFEIHLLRSGSIVQPDGMVTVRLPVPEGTNPNKLKVFYVSDDVVNPLVRYTSTIDGNYIVFETNHFSQYAVIEVEPTLSSLEISQLPSDLTFNVGDAFNTSGLTVTATYSDGLQKSVTDYTVSNVDTSTAGQKKVSIYYTDGDITKTASYTVTVNSVEAASVSIVSPPQTVRYKSSFVLTATVSPENTTDKAVTWVSSDESVISLGSDGRFIAVGKGTATLTATTASGVSSKCTVEVKYDWWQWIVLFVLFGFIWY